MPPRARNLLGLLVALAPSTTRAEEWPTPRARREAAARALAIAAALEPVETAGALRTAQKKFMQEGCASRGEKDALRHAVQQGVARGLASAVGGGTAAWVVLRLVVATIPVVPSVGLVRAVVGSVAACSAASELAGFLDEATADLICMNGELGRVARHSIAERNPQSLLLAALDHQLDSLHRPRNTYTLECDHEDVTGGTGQERVDSATTTTDEMFDLKYQTR